MEQIEKIQGTEKEFIKVFQELCYSRSSWQVWADLMAAMACTLANSVDKTEPRYTAREKEYAECIKRLGGVEKPAKCFAIVVEALERNPDQDFLGKLYMSLELGNHWKGQFFTPYNVCECMAKTRYELLNRANAAADALVGKVDNDTNGRATIMAAIQGICNAMEAEGKIQYGNVTESTTVTTDGDTCGFDIEVIDLDSAEHIYLNY